MKDENKRNKLVTESKIYSEKVQLAQQTKEERLEIAKLVSEERLLQR